MILMKQLELIKLMHKLIAKSDTGVPSVFASRVGISERRLYEIIDEMKSFGAPIAYSRIYKTYYYTQEIEASISCSFQISSPKEQ